MVQDLTPWKEIFDKEVCKSRLALEVYILMSSNLVSIGDTKILCVSMGTSVGDEVIDLSCETLS